MTDSMSSSSGYVFRDSSPSESERGPYAIDEEEAAAQIENSRNGLSISWQNLVITSKNKKVLQGISGEVQGSLMAIMGSSGSGKTTLMNALANRIPRGFKTDGDIRINGFPCTKSLLKRVSAYVIQDDLLFAHLTVEETLLFAANLRLPSTMTSEERKTRVEGSISQLGLESCRHVIVGGTEKKGISGGERKRLCVGIEILTHPRLLFLDEPTSGLDSTTALALVTTLKELVVQRNCTILCTIHQPQSKIFQMFDHVMVMNKGKLVYCGETDRILETYALAGFPCPPLTNPADHIIDVITPSTADQSEEAQQNAEMIHNEMEPFDVSDHGDEALYQLEARIPWHQQFYLLWVRSLKESLRQRSVMVTQLLQSIIIAVLIGTVFLQIGTDQDSTVRRQPVLFFCVINQGIFGALMLINSFPSERAITLRERAAGSYFVSAYFLAKSAAEACFQIVYPIIFSCIVYWLVGLQASFSKFMVFTGFIVLCSFASTSTALLISTVCRTTTMSVNVLPMALEITRLFGGFFLSPKDLPSYFVWIDSVSYVKYAYVGISLNELTGLTLYCKEDQLVNGECPVTSGTQTIEALGLDELTVAQCASCLFGIILVTRVLAYLALRFIKR